MSAESVWNSPKAAHLLASAGMKKDFRSPLLHTTTECQFPVLRLFIGGIGHKVTGGLFEE